MNGVLEKIKDFILIEMSFNSQQINCQEAVLHVTKDGDVVRDYCIVHNHSWTPLSPTLKEAVSFCLIVF